MPTVIVFCKSYCWQVKPWEYFCLSENSWRPYFVL